MQQAATSGSDLPRLVTEAMTAIEAEFKPLDGVLPKDYGIFEPKVLEDLMRLFNSAQIKQVTGDVFGRIYEYFLAKFSIQKAHDLRLNQHVMIIRVDATLADPSFVLCAINSDQRKRPLLSYAQVGATREALTKETVTNFQIVLPDEKLLRQFGEVARDINPQREVLAHQNADLRTARDLLLPRLMSGEIAV